MFGFIYNTFTQARGIFYDGNKENLRYCLNQKEAERRWEKRGNTSTYKMKLYGNKYIDVILPIADWAEWYSEWLEEYARESNISLMSKQLISQLLDEYYCNDEGKFFPRENKRKWEISWVLMQMRDVIEGMFRIEPIKILTWVDKLTKKGEYIDMPFGQDVFDVKYSVGGKNYVTNIFWLYSSSLRKLMFPDSNFGGNTLQPWQIDGLYNRGQYTFLIGPREWGKSLLSATITAQWILKEISNPSQENLRGIQILYYGQSNDSNVRYYNYVKSLLKKMFSDSKMMKANDSWQIITIADGSITREIRFISHLSEAKGRWERPSLVILDEASRLDDEVWEIALGTTWIPIIAISTVNYETKRNWFYDEFIKAEKAQRYYEPIDELIHRIWIKYWFDMCYSRDHIKEMINNGDFVKARNEFYESRQRVALRYTIDDIDPSLMSENQKRIKLDHAASRGEKFVMAEYYWFYVDEQDLFSTDWLIVNSIPTKFDKIAIWYDPAQDFDNAWLCAVGIKDRIAYVIESIKLSKDVAVQTRQIKDMRNKLKNMLMRVEWNIPLWVDITRWSWDLVVLEDRSLFVDYPIKFTKGKNISYKWREHLVWKEYLVKDVVRDQFFWKNNVRFPTTMVWEEWWLLEEISNYKEKNIGTNKFSAWKWKDDQVTAMMIALYVCWDMWLRHDYIKQEVVPDQKKYVKLSELVKQSKTTPQSKDFFNSVTYWR